MEANASADFLAQLSAGMAPIAKTRRFLIAVSGGRDSVALLHGLLALGYRRLIVVHLDHGLRGRASAADARFVASLAKKNALPIVRAKADTRAYARERGISLELAARELRFVLFAAAARRHRCRSVLLAHHAEDQIETCLHNFLRGSGPAGLTGMRRESIHPFGKTPLTLIRPMLSIRRSAIDACLRERTLEFREDSSNLSAAHTRNRLRHSVIPAISEAIGESFGDAILRAARIFEAEDAWMRREVEKFAITPEMPLARLAGLPLALQRRLVRRWLEASGLSDIGFAEVERVLSMLEIEHGPAKVNLPGNAHARRRQGVIFLEIP